MSSVGQVSRFPDDELKEIMKKSLTSYKLYSLVDGFVFPEHFAGYLNDIHSFEIKNDDVVLCGYPKSGTTWLQELVWCITSDLNFEEAKEVDINERFPYFEYTCLLPKDYLKKIDNPPAYMIDSLEYVKNTQGRRFIKTHLPLKFLPRQLQADDRKAKMVYMCRDPRDVCVSFYHHQKKMKAFTGTFGDFLKLFIGNRVLFTPYWDHVLPFWKNRDQPNLLVVTYEEMKRDLPPVIRRVAAFLDKTLTPDQVASLAEHVSVASMKNNKAVNGDLKENNAVHSSYVRVGKSGGFRNEMTPEQIETFDAWAKDNLKGTDFFLDDNL